MIDLEALTAHAGPRAIGPVTASLGPGVHVLLGGREDGVGLLLDVLAARVRPRAGRVSLLGSKPDSRAARRARVHVGLELSWPDVLRVDELLAIASASRGERPRDAAERLDVLGLASLAGQRVASLTRGEARGVALAEALTGEARVLLVDEPFLALDPRAGATLARAIAARAAAGASVVVATASVRDARDLAGDVLTFARGREGPRLASGDARIVTGRDGVRLRVVATPSRALLAAVAADPAVRAVDAEAGAFVLAGDDLLALAGAVARAVLRVDAARAPSDPEVRVDSLRPDPAPLDDVRAADATPVRSEPEMPAPRRGEQAPAPGEMP